MSAQKLIQLFLAVAALSAGLAFGQGPIRLTPCTRFCSNDPSFSGIQPPDPRHIETPPLLGRSVYAKVISLLHFVT